DRISLVHRIHREERELQGRQRPPADEDGDDRSRPQRQATDDRRPVRRNARTARRLLSRRRQGSRRGGRHRRAHSGIAHRLDRGASHHADVTDVVENVQQQIARIYRDDSRRILATLIRLLGDFDLAEEAMQDAFALAVGSWQSDSIPSNPRAWLISAARHRSIDRARRDARTIALSALAAPPESPPPAAVAALDDESGVEDNRLRLVFTCCHPTLAQEAQVALTLRTVCGLTTEQIARAFLVPIPTMAQRLVRATGKIRDAGIPYRVPSAHELPARLDAVLTVVYLVFTEGYAATGGDERVRHELCGEAIRLARLVVELMPDAAEANGLLALMLLHDARRATRLSPEGEL